MQSRTGLVIALVAGVVTVGTVIWVGASVAAGAGMTDRATVGQFVLALVGLLTTTWATRHAFGSGRDTAAKRAPRLVVTLDTRAACQELQEFLRRHDGEVVYLSMSCGIYVAGDKRNWFPAQAWSFCGALGNWSQDSPMAYQLWTRTNSGHGFPLSDPSSARAVMKVIVPQHPRGSTVAVASNDGNLSSGAGGLTIKGYFYVGLSGTGSLGPPGVAAADLVPVSPPVG